MLVESWILAQHKVANAVKEHLQKSNWPAVDEDSMVIDDAEMDYDSDDSGLENLVGVNAARERSLAS